MRSIKTVSLAFSNAFLFALIIVATAATVSAQTNSLGDAWKGQKKINTGGQATGVDSTGQIKVEETQAAAVETVPVEPKVAPAMAPAPSGKVALNSARLELPSKLVPADELSGIGPAHSFQATAYSLPGKTRSGARVRRGVLAADPRVLPLGTVVQLKAGNYSGVYTVHDTGGAIKGRLVDVWMPTSKEARTFGRRSVKLTVLKYGGTQKKKR